MNVHHDKPACWTETATPRTFAGRDATACKAWENEAEAMQYQPGCRGCARLMEES